MAVPFSSLMVQLAKLYELLLIEATLTLVERRTFVWESPRPRPEYRHKAMEDFYAGWEMEHFQAARTTSGFILHAYLKAARLWLFYRGPVLSPALVPAPWLLRPREMRLLPAAGAMVVLALGTTVWFMPQYAAPATGLLYALLLEGMRRLRTWQACVSEQDGS